MVREGVRTRERLRGSAAEKGSRKREGGCEPSERWGKRASESERTREERASDVQRDKEFEKAKGASLPMSPSPYIIHTREGGSVHVCVREGVRSVQVCVAEPITPFWPRFGRILHRSEATHEIAKLQWRGDSPKSRPTRRQSRLAQRPTLLAPSLLFMLKDRGHRKTRLVASHVMRCAFRSRAEVIFLEGEYRAASLPMIPILM